MNLLVLNSDIFDHLNALIKDRCGITINDNYYFFKCEKDFKLEQKIIF